ncbi:MAG TPA: energy transducer TonB [Hellea balneolensis]|uniref:Energy transducer TonB n=1 Tax=Hellea balneolensis TaxID=287478 RepID=A0A7C5LUH5_9PROT|nr:energy transducer TonB [Hellea balneolensis]
MKPAFLIILFGLTGCASTAKPFMPRSDYPIDPWVKGYADPDDCIGGEKLAARNFDLPKYPKRAYKNGRQGWVILRLDVDASGVTQNVHIERALPDQSFGGGAVKAARKWRFEPPRDGALKNCRVLIRYRLGKVSLGA